MNSSWLTFNNLCLVAFLFRLLLLFYGEWQDANLTVKYTDIDYVVFTDAARYVTLDSSPYLRETYRYTPLLAILLTPNIYLFHAFGKCLFAAADLVVGYLIHQILILRGMPSKRALFFDALWLLNPMVANISTRGNAESLLGAMMLGTLYLLLTKSYFYYGACLFGLAVHFKIYPIIYAVPLLIMLDENTYGSDPVEWPQIMRSYQYYRFHLLDMLNQSRESRVRRYMREIVLFFSPVRIMFGAVSAACFFLLTALMYQK
jgi:phosphatidylinositol glycan class M